MVLVTGATGAVGPCVVQALCETGYIVRTFSMDKPLPGTMPPNVDERQAHGVSPYNID